MKSFSDSSFILQTARAAYSKQLSTHKHRQKLQQPSKDKFTATERSITLSELLLKWEKRMRLRKNKNATQGNRSAGRKGLQQEAMLPKTCHRMTKTQHWHWHPTNEGGYRKIQKMARSCFGRSWGMHGAYILTLNTLVPLFLSLQMMRWCEWSILDPWNELDNAFPATQTNTNMRHASQTQPWNVDEERSQAPMSWT